MNTNEMQDLYVKRSSSKNRMILGIILAGAGLFFSFLEVACLFLEAVMFFVFLFLFISMPLMVVGTILFIVGLVEMTKASRAIYNSGTQSNAQFGQQQYQPRFAQQCQPQAEPRFAQQYQPQAEPRFAQQYQSVGGEENATSNSNGFVDLDWRKYAPLEAGVSIKPNKDYKFHRAEGFVGSVPQSFVNRTFPKCPICCSQDPYWTIAQHNQMSWKGNLYLFKCSCCDSIISMSMPDVTTLGNGGVGFAANASVGLTNLLVKANTNKEVGSVYAVIESVGRSGVTPECQGKEFKLEHLQDMFLRK